MDNTKAMELIEHLAAQNTAMHEMLEKIESYISNDTERWWRPEMLDVLDEFDEIKDEETPHWDDYLSMKQVDVDVPIFRKQYGGDMSAASKVACETKAQEC